MKFVKGAVIGSVATVAAMMLYQDMNRTTKNKIIKKGKQFARKVRVI